MAEPRGETRGKFPQDDLVSKIVKDAKQPPDALLLTGYVGHSSEPGHVRLYLDAQFGDYVEIPEESVLHIQEIPKESSPLGGSFVWMKRDAEVVHGKVGPDRPKSKFLEGRIQQDFLMAAAARPGQPALPMPPQTHPPLCGTLLPFACPPPRTDIDPCPPPHTLHGLPCPPPPTPFCTVPPQCLPPPTPGCTAPPQCPLQTQCPPPPTPFCPPQTVPPGCPPPPTPNCPPHTPLHGCPPPTGAFQTAAPCCHTLPNAACPFPTPHIHCPQPFMPISQLPDACPIHSQFCPTLPHCPPPSQLCPSHLVICPTAHGCPTQAVHCPPTQFCPSHFVICPTGHGCPTQAVHCPPSQFCPSHFLICPTGFSCPTLAVNCPPTKFCPSALACPSAFACPSIACTPPGGGGFGGGGFLGA